VKKRDLERQLKVFGFIPDGGTKHDKWTHPVTGKSLTVPRHTEINENLAKGILKQAKKILEEDKTKDAKK